jgi:hypothetical protein
MQEVSAKEMEPVFLESGTSDVFTASSPTTRITWPQGDLPSVEVPALVQPEVPRDVSFALSLPMTRSTFPRESDAEKGFGDVPHTRTVLDVPTYSMTDVKELQERIVTLEKENSELVQALEYRRGQVNSLRERLASITLQLGEIQRDLTNLQVGL